MVKNDNILSKYNFLHNGDNNDRLPTNIVHTAKNAPNIQINLKCLQIKIIVSTFNFNYKLGRFFTEIS